MCLPFRLEHVVGLKTIGYINGCRPAISPRKTKSSTVLENQSSSAVHSMASHVVITRASGLVDLPIKPQLTEHQVAKILNVSVHSVRRWRQSGFGPAWVKFGSAVRYCPDALIEWMRSQPAGGGGK